MYTLTMRGVTVSASTLCTRARATGVVRRLSFCCSTSCFFCSSCFHLVCSSPHGVWGQRMPLLSCRVSSSYPDGLPRTSRSRTLFISIGSLDMQRFLCVLSSLDIFLFVAQSLQTPPFTLHLVNGQSGCCCACVFAASLPSFSSSGFLPPTLISS